jgi:hypothetical protein
MITLRLWRTLRGDESLDFIVVQISLACNTARILATVNGKPSLAPGSLVCKRHNLHATLCTPLLHNLGLKCSKLVAMITKIYTYIHEGFKNIKNGLNRDLNFK